MPPVLSIPWPPLQYASSPLDSLASSTICIQSSRFLGRLYNVPPVFSIPCSASPFIHTHLSQVHGHVIQPTHFWSSSSSCCIKLSVHLFWDCGVLHYFYMTEPS